MHAYKTLNFKNNLKNSRCKELDLGSKSQLRTENITLNEWFKGTAGRNSKDWFVTAGALAWASAMRKSTRAAALSYTLNWGASQRAYFAMAKQGSDLLILIFVSLLVGK